MPTTKPCSASLAHPTGAATDRSEPALRTSAPGYAFGGTFRGVKTRNPFCDGPFLAFYGRRGRLGRHGLTLAKTNATRPVQTFIQVYSACEALICTNTFPSSTFTG
jgi:hypothetical protein